MCITKVLYLPQVKNGKVRQVRNRQHAGESKWLLARRDHENFDWQPTSESFYGYTGSHAEAWVELKEGDCMTYWTTTSASPAIKNIVWRDGCWQAWVTTAPMGRRHWTKLVVGKPLIKDGDYCDTGIFCPDA